MGLYFNGTLRQIKREVRYVKHTDRITHNSQEIQEDKITYLKVLIDAARIKIADDRDP